MSRLIWFYHLLKMMKKNNSLYNEIKLYLAYLQFERKLSSNTVNSYWLDLKYYISYLEDSYSIKSFNSIKSLHIKQYIKDLSSYKNSNQKENATLNRTISSIKNFHKYLFLNNKVKTNSSEMIKSIKLKQSLPKILSVEEIDLIINSIDKNSKNAIRDISIITLLYSSGLRVSELTELTLSNFYIKEEVLRVLGKGKKERIVPISSKAKECMLEYIDHVRPRYSNKNETKGIVFLSNRGKALSRKTVWNLIKIASINASITKDVSPHTFRHSFASHLLEGGADLRVVQELLGHSSVSTTQIYTHLDKTYLKEIHKEFHPRG